MTPAARTQAAIEILDEILGKQIRFEDFFRKWSRQHRYAGSKDRAAIKETVFQVFRNRAMLQWMAPDAQGRLLVAGLMRWIHDLSRDDLALAFNGGDYGPAPLSDHEWQRLETGTPAHAPKWAQLNIPKWLEGELRRRFGDTLEDELQAMSGRAALHIRTNRLKTTRDRLSADLTERGVENSSLTLSPDGLELPTGTRLQDTDLYKSGAFEIQDLGSQIVGLVCAAKPGETVVDLAAGAGGKALHLAATMENQGRLVACDADEARMKDLSKRASRAGVTCVETHVLTTEARGRLSTEISGRADLVLVDAPCSGSGTWRRRPEARWWLTPKSLEKFVSAQKALLELAADLVKPGGRLVYVTCSILPTENQEVVSAFQVTNPAFKVIPSALVWPGGANGAPEAEHGMGIELTPLRHNTDGFFISVFVKNPVGTT